MGWVVNATPRPLYPQERTGTCCIGGWVGPSAGLDGFGKSRPFHRDSIPGPSGQSLYRLSYPSPLYRYREANNIISSACWSFFVADKLKGFRDGVTCNAVTQVPRATKRYQNFQLLSVFRTFAWKEDLYRVAQKNVYTLYSSISLE